MLIIHIREIRDKLLLRWILALYDTEKKRFAAPPEEDEILRYNENKEKFQGNLEEILVRFKKRGCTNVSSKVREEIFEDNGLMLPRGWNSFKT